MRSALIFRCFISRHPELLVKAFTAFALPILEYAIPVFNPYYLKIVTAIENVQRRFTKLIPGFADVPYSERLSTLGLDSLELRRIRADLVMCYQIIHGLVNLSFSDFFIFAPDRGTRGYRWKLYFPFSTLDVRKATFASRVVPIWNSLPENCVAAESCNAFKTNLLSVNLTRFLTYKM